MTRWKIEELRPFRNYIVEWIDGEKVLLSRGNVLYEAPSFDGPLRERGRLPISLLKNAMVKFRLGRRLGRLNFYNVLRCPDDTLFTTFDKSIGLFDGDRYIAVEGITRPCRVLRSGCAMNEAGDIFFGEYIPNMERGPISIYRLPRGSITATPVYTFPARTVRHVHGIYYDAFRRALWITAGDIGEECRLMVTDDEFRTLDIVGSGDETWRSVSIVCRAECIYYGTDSEFRRNAIYRLDRTTGRREKIHEVDGTVFYSYTVGNDTFFGSTAELCPSNPERTASVWHIDESGNCQAILTLKKDVWPTKYFQFGHYCFPCLSSPGNGDALHFHAIGLARADGKTFRATHSRLVE